MPLWDNRLFAIFRSDQSLPVYDDCKPQGTAGLVEPIGPVFIQFSNDWYCRPPAIRQWHTGALLVFLCGLGTDYRVDPSSQPSHTPSFIASMAPSAIPSVFPSGFPSSFRGHQVWNSSTFSTIMTSGFARCAQSTTTHARSRICFWTGLPPLALEKCLQSGENHPRPTSLPSITSRGSTCQIFSDKCADKWPHQHA